MDSSLFGGFLLGLVGSFHCVGMCAPIALALPQIGASRGSQLTSAALYNLGRSSSYGLLGAVAGGLGLGVLLAQWQQTLSLVIGAALLLSVLLPLLAPKQGRLNFGDFLGKILSPMLRKAMAKPSQSRIFTLGLLNGFLPCGLVYTALGAATLSLKPTSGALYMLAFGLGTAPLMFVVTYSRYFVPLLWRQRLQKLIPITISLMAIYFILRGLGLGIPYFSPILPTAGAPDIATLPLCH
jgi:sulfite exporter TauE/SafE